jgi:hypothetical protein
MELLNSIKALCGLANEAKLKSTPSEDNELLMQVAAAEYMASIFEVRFKTTKNADEFCVAHKCYMECKQHAERLRTEMEIERIRNEYHKQAI